MIQYSMHCEKTGSSPSFHFAGRRRHAPALARLQHRPQRRRSCSTRRRGCGDSLPNLANVSRGLDVPNSSLRRMWPLRTAHVPPRISEASSVLERTSNWSRGGNGSLDQGAPSAASEDGPPPRRFRACEGAPVSLPSAASVGLTRSGCWRPCISSRARSNARRASERVLSGVRPRAVSDSGGLSATVAPPEPITAKGPRPCNKPD
mmetsp:Transcript_26314/g.83303  ORF Transcript_26314/g.83303 Transcript_26314/m.83303 type:complete len:205 (+) Transcript_26314:413-1027(+)